jgi:hypothetical protein
LLLDQQALPINPANKCCSKDTKYGYSERSNPSFVLLEVEYQVAGANRIQRVGEIEKEANAWGNTQDMQTFSR